MAQSLASVQERFDRAMSDYEAGSYVQAHAGFIDLAARGHSAAETMLGVMHYRGHGVDEDHRSALIWFFKAARRGNSNAQLALGSMLANGRGTKPDRRGALKWLLLAADTGLDPVVAEANRLADLLLADLSPDVVARVRRDVERWQPLRRLDP